jgi:hypothetical protein
MGSARKKTYEANAAVTNCKRKVIRTPFSSILVASSKLASERIRTQRHMLQLTPKMATAIHPYMDGNGPMGRFLMNVMMAAGGYPWTVIPLSSRNTYIAALEKASAGEDIAPLAEFLVGLVRKRFAGESLPPVPRA